MKTLFPSHFASCPERIEKLWGECIFVVDTNVLTGIYKYSDETRDALYRVIGSLGERLWVPYQVMFEYLDNRAKIVFDQSKLYASAISKLEELKSDIDVPTRPPFVSAEIYEDFCRSAERVLEDLKSRRDLHEARITNDDVKEHLAVLLDGKIGPGYSSAILEALAVEGDRRYSQKIPPGFEDKDKHKGSVLTKEINKRYGDLIFWKQILDKAKESGTSVILVTGERKEDWWSQCGGKTIGPLPELMEEFATVTGKEFYIYSTHSFLHLANDYLHQDTSPAAVEEVRDAFVSEMPWLARMGNTEITLLEDLDDDNEDVSLSGRYSADYYRQLGAKAESAVEQLEEVIINLKQKLREAEAISSPAVVKIYEERLAHVLGRRKSLRMKQRYYARKLSQMLRDNSI
ncbi:PIN-like domain-containing protein [Pseudomonas sp. TAE6080]|uniref:PIN-like domain-containing protein n=1 Tax=Pseudomonas sp. TAE6080 TaxID=2840374 RepID=UPI001BFFED9E|nr:PIN-like domain-containing protein [Pseudomonas sp. TAE6080]MBT9299768.1 DUF4935 domain-containing protein [Pseudomonas sp. TAE6080]